MKHSELNVTLRTFLVKRLSSLIALAAFRVASIAIGTVISFLKERATSIKEVVFVLFDSRTYESYCSALQEMMGEES